MVSLYQLHPKLFLETSFGVKKSSSRDSNKKKERKNAKIGFALAVTSGCIVGFPALCSCFPKFHFAPKTPRLIRNIHELWLRCHQKMRFKKALLELDPLCVILVYLYTFKSLIGLCFVSCHQVEWRSCYGVLTYYARVLMIVAVLQAKFLSAYENIHIVIV